VFTDASHLIRRNPPERHFGVAVADLDGDGDFELFVCGFGGPNRVLKWDGMRYTDIADDVLADVGRWSIAAAAGDIDADGREELYLLVTDSFSSGRDAVADRLFDYTGSGWVDLFALPENRAVRNLAAGRSVMALDRFGTGRYGFFVATSGGSLKLFERDSRGRVMEMAAAAGLDRFANGRGAVALPLVSDAASDVVVTVENGANLVFRNRGDGTFEEIAAAVGLADPFENGLGVAAVDLDGDGRLELAVTNWEGPSRLWTRGVTGFRDATPPEFAKPGRPRTLIAADFDNDGYAELFVNNHGEPNRLFGWRDGRWRSLDIDDALEAAGLGTGAAVGDFDGDGRLELLVTHGEAAAQPMTLYQGPDNGRSWLRVLPLTQHGAPARGATVRLRAAGRTQVRLIDPGSGYLCQMEPIAHFGLGRLDAVQLVEVTWPDGATAVLETPEVCQTVTVEHPGSD